MGLTEFALSQALKMALNHIDRSNIVVKTARELDLLADEKLGEKGSESVQERLVIQILLPIARELMKENSGRYNQILEAEQHGFLGESFGGSDISGDREDPGTRQNFQPKN